MDERGAIARFETDEDAKRAGYSTSLSEAEAASLLPRNRHERRAELTKMRRERKKESKNHG